MSRLLRSDRDELEAYVSRVVVFTGIPADDIEKDFWVTAVLRLGLSGLSTRGT